MIIDIDFSSSESQNSTKCKKTRLIRKQPQRLHSSGSNDPPPTDVLALCPSACDKSMLQRALHGFRNAH